ncbi:hypothetical protein AAW14_00950 [Streptomyces hygroscopicus]|uniref:SRPBCC family protein n=1 Tax=Streptomyces hygroscopicus TaxID=1912 RepID=UPI00223F9AAA|nr:SRPBCC family protein [Streptomyces hygroscopicus]MCW7940646.1 hypothetical protein [Streptomyces hygroscopicus]
MSSVTAVTSLTESVVIRVPPDTAYAAVSDVARMGEWSPECRGAWVPRRRGPLMAGMWFLGRNRARLLPWVTLCRVVVADPGHCFAFRVSFLAIPLSRWTYSFAPLPDGCQVTELWEDRRGLLGRVFTTVAALTTGVVRRSARNQVTMRATLEALRDTLEPGG